MGGGARELRPFCNPSTPAGGGCPRQPRASFTAVGQAQNSSSAPAPPHTHRGTTCWGHWAGQVPSQAPPGLSGHSHEALRREHERSGPGAKAAQGQAGPLWVSHRSAGTPLWSILRTTRLRCWSGVSSARKDEARVFEARGGEHRDLHGPPLRVLTGAPQEIKWVMQQGGQGWGLGGLL